MKKQIEKESKVWYYVSDTNNLTDKCIDNCAKTLQVAYDEELQSNGSSPKLYAFEIKLLGEIKNELTIKN